MTTAEQEAKTDEYVAKTLARAPQLTPDQPPAPDHNHEGRCQMRGELIPVPVPGADALMAVQASGRAWAALKPMCDSLGIDFSGQLQKLKGRSWATVVQRSTVANDGRTREMVFVDSRTIPMWLATIDEHRVAEEAKPKLIAYQCEAAEALDAYFNQRVSNVPAVNQFDVLRAAIDQIEAAQREASEAKALAQRTEARLDGIEGRHDWLSALAYSKIHGLHTSEAATRQLGISASRIARQRGIEPEKTQHSHYGAVNKYPSWIWDQARPEPPN